jgi:hypothetical protein
MEQKSNEMHSDYVGQLIEWQGTQNNSSGLPVSCAFGKDCECQVMSVECLDLLCRIKMVISVSIFLCGCQNHHHMEMAISMVAAHGNGHFITLA